MVTQQALHAYIVHTVSREIQFQALFVGLLAQAADEHPPPDELFAALFEWGAAVALAVAVAAAAARAPTTAAATVEASSSKTRTWTELLVAKRISCDLIQKAKKFGKNHGGKIGTHPAKNGKTHTQIHTAVQPYIPEIHERPTQRCISYSQTFSRIVKSMRTSAGTSEARCSRCHRCRQRHRCCSSCRRRRRSGRCHCAGCCRRCDCRRRCRRHSSVGRLVGRLPNHHHITSHHITAHITSHHIAQRVVEKKKNNARTRN